MEIKQIFINGAWLGVGGNTMWREFGSITKLERDTETNIIYMHFDDGVVVEIKNENYMISY